MSGTQNHEIPTQRAHHTSQSKTSISHTNSASNSTSTSISTAPTPDNPNASFNTLGLSAQVMMSLRALHYTTPTPVQQQAIPAILEGRDVCAAAATGTGKTAAFLLPVLTHLPHGKHIRLPKQQGTTRANTQNSRRQNGNGVKNGSSSCNSKQHNNTPSTTAQAPQLLDAATPSLLVITPTRELAEQIGTTCATICRNTQHHLAVVYGGTKYPPQITKLRCGVDILIATPGRLMDLRERGVIDLSRVSTLVLDEADRMLDMGFWPAVQSIIADIPPTRQTLLFSATLDKKILAKIQPILHNPVRIEIITHGDTAKTVDQYILPVQHSQKQELLHALLMEKGFEKVIVFARTKHRAEHCCKILQREKFRAESIHSDKSQANRRKALENFSRGKTNILVATDVLARGIDVPQVNYVVNFDLPDFPDDYIHRIGRTGRAGETGFAVSFVSPESLSALRQIQRLIHTELPLLPLETVPIDTAILEEQPNQVRSGLRSEGRTGGRTNRHADERSDGHADGRAGHTRMHFTRANKAPVVLRERNEKRVRNAAYKDRNTRNNAAQQSEKPSGGKNSKSQGRKPKGARFNSTTSNNAPGRKPKSGKSKGMHGNNALTSGAKNTHPKNSKTKNARSNHAGAKGTRSNYAASSHSAQRSAKPQRKR